MENGELIPKNSNESQRGAKNHLTRVPVLTTVDAKFVFDCVVHRANISDGLTNLIAETIRPPKKFGRSVSGLGQTEELGCSTKDCSKRRTHDGDGTDWPDLIEDKGHDDQREQDANGTVSRGSQVGGRRKTDEN